MRSDKLSAGSSLTEQNPAANSSSWATQALGRARPAFLATPSNPFVVQQRSHDFRLKSLLRVEAVAHGAVVETDRGCRRRIEQRKAMLGKQLGHRAPEVCPEESMARIGLELREHFGRKRWKVPDDQHLPGLICGENRVEQRQAVP